MISIRGFRVSSQYPIIDFPILSNAKYNLTYIYFFWNMYGIYSTKCPLKESEQFHQFSSVRMLETQTLLTVLKDYPCTSACRLLSLDYPFKLSRLVCSSVPDYILSHTLSDSLPFSPGAFIYNLGCGGWKG